MTANRGSSTYALMFTLIMVNLELIERATRVVKA
jgi:hypothetical protein